MPDKNSDTLLRDNLRAIAEQDAKMAGASDAIATEGEVINAVDMVERHIATELTNRSDARKVQDGFSASVASKRIEELVRIRSGLYDGTYHPATVSDVIADKVDPIGAKAGNGISEPADDHPVSNETDTPALEPDGDATDKDASGNDTHDVPADDEPNDADTDAVRPPSDTKEGNDGEAAVAPTDDDILEKATEDVIADEDARPIVIDTSSPMTTRRKPRHAKGKESKAGRRHHWNPFAALWRILVDMVREIAQITWPSGKVLATMTLKTLVSMIVFGVLVAVVDFGSSQLIGCLYSLRP